MCRQLLRSSQLETEWTPIASGEDEPSGKTLSLDSQGELEDCQIP